MKKAIYPDNLSPFDAGLLEHYARYEFAVPYVSGRAMDAGTGSGYGAQLLTKKRNKNIDTVYAVDISHENIKYARGRYHHPKIEYVEADLFNTDIRDLDCIICFGVEDETLLPACLYEQLADGGQLIITVQNQTPAALEQLAWQACRFYGQNGVAFEPLIPEKTYQSIIAVCIK